MSFRRAGCIAVLAVACFFMFKVNSAESITIRPAAFDHIIADVPKEVMAGVEFEVGITFVDRYGNPMAQNWKPETSLTLNISQPASVQPSVLAPSNYYPGFKYSVHTEKMGKMTLSLRDDKGRVLDQWDLTIKSGRPVKLLVDLPTGAEVGETVTMSLQAVDAHGNVAFGYVPDLNSIVLESGAAGVAGAIEARAGGVYELPVKFNAPGSQSITLRDRKRSLTGSSAAVNVTPAPLGSFEIRKASDQSVAGEEFALSIRALDRHGNLLDDYGSRYKGIRLYSGSAGIAPDLVPPSSFSNGVANVGFVMKSAGDHRIKVSELQSNVSGEFGLRIVPAGVKTLRVKTPDAATAGEPFEITIISEDQFGNRTPSIPAGSFVKLNSTGSGVLDPGTVKASEFKNGEARIKVSYEKAESFDILAELSGAQKVSAASPPVDEREKGRISALKAREEAVRARRESRLREKRVSDQVQKQPEAFVPETKRAPEPIRQKPPVPSPAPVKRNEPAKTPEKPVPAVAVKKVLRPGILDGITVDEIENRALVTFSTNGMTDYNVTTSAKLSRKWIDIEFPDMAVDLSDRVSSGEKIVGEVYVEPSEGDGPGVRVSVEILPSRIGYDVYQEGQSIVLKINKQ